MGGIASCYDAWKSFVFLFLISGLFVGGACVWYRCTRAGDGEWTCCWLQHCCVREYISKILIATTSFCDAMYVYGCILRKMNSLLWSAVLEMCVMQGHDEFINHDTFSHLSGACSFRIQKKKKNSHSKASMV